jgi:SAM-dependent methyltransferase
LHLGKLPLANALRRADTLDQPEPAYDLDLAFCQACALVQLVQAVPAEVISDEHCPFASGSDAQLRHAAELALHMIRTRRLGQDSLVIEAGSNDGYLLRNYRDGGVPVLGIEPGREVARAARQWHGIPTREAAFSRPLADLLASQRLHCDVFHAHSVLAHTPDLNPFLRGVRGVLKNDGVALIEVPYVKDMLDNRAFDAVHHEHVCYFSLTSLSPCFTGNGLLIVDVERVPIHGGSLRLYAAPARPGVWPAPQVGKMLAEEEAWGVRSLETYSAFGRRAEELKQSLRELLADLKSKGHRLAGYGASARGSTLLNYCGIGRETLEFVVDRDTVRQGHFTPGSALPIHPPEKLLEEMPEYTLLLTRHHPGESQRHEEEYLRRGGRFITPTPVPKVA